MFPWRNGEVLLCDILGRGWCIPSGRVEPDEDSAEAVRREALEEAGAVLEDLQYIGCYQISERSEVRWADCYTARVVDLVEITASQESSGRKFVPPCELGEIYHVWNELTDQVFQYSFDVLTRLQDQKH